MMEYNPEIIRFNATLGDQASRLDQLETRAWNARGMGLYVAPDIPPEVAEKTAGDVALTLAYISLEGQP